MSIKEKVLTWVISLVIGAGGAAAVAVPISITVPQQLIDQAVEQAVDQVVEQALQNFEIDKEPDKEKEEPKLTLEQRQQREIIAVLESDFAQRMKEKIKTFPTRELVMNGSEEWTQEMSIKLGLLRSEFEESVIKEAGFKEAKFDFGVSDALENPMQCEFYFSAGTVRDNYIRLYTIRAAYLEDGRFNEQEPIEFTENQNLDYLKDLWGIE